MSGLLRRSFVPLVLALGVAGVPRIAWADWRDPARPRPQEPAAKTQFDEVAWRARLTQADLAERERALDEVAELARRDQAVRKALADWAKDGKNPDLAWTSRLALREVDNARMRVRQRDRFAQRADLRDDFELLFAHIEDLQSQMDRVFAGENEPGAEPGAHHAQSELVELQLDANGVRCRVVKEVDGKRDEQEYRAATLGELLAMHPELRQHIRSRVAEPFGLERFWGPFLRTPRTDMLGVEVGSPTAELVQALALEAGHGLLVQRTLRGSIAEAMGIRPGDVLIKLNDVAIRSAEDVAKVLQGRAKNADIVAVVGDKDGKKRTLSWKPPAVSPPASAAEASVRWRRA